MSQGLLTSLEGGEEVAETIFEFWRYSIACINDEDAIILVLPLLQLYFSAKEERVLTNNPKCNNYLCVSSSN